MMKNETIAQNINEQLQAACQSVSGQTAVTQTVEKEYINSMLNINYCNMAGDESPINIVNSPLSHEAVELSFNKQADVECKVFSVAGLNFALPLSCVKAILQQHQILSGSGRGLHIGTVKHNDEEIKVIDLTCLIIPGEDNTDKVAERLVDIILLKGTSVGIIYEQDLEDQMISPQQVCWRNATSDRYWLAGTVKQKSLSLLDLEGIVKLLSNKGSSINS